MSGARAEPRWIWPAAAALLAVPAAAPLIAVIAALFSPADAVWTHVRASLLPEAVGNSAVLVMGVATLSTVIGVATAWLVATTRFPGRGWLSWALALPLAAPGYIVAYVYADLLEFAGPVQSALRGVTGWGAGDYAFPAIRSLSGAIFVLSLGLYPYVYILARAAFARRSATLYLAARTLGAGPMRAFAAIALPAARAAIAGGAALAAMETLADFGVADYFGITTFSTALFRTWLALDGRTAALKLAAVMLIVIAALVWLEQATRKGRAASLDGAPAALTPLAGWRAWLVSISCALPVTLGVVIPAAVLARYAVIAGDPLWGTRFAPIIGNSLTVAGAAALIATLAALILAQAQRLAPPASLNARLTAPAIRFATLGYALPGALLALGLFAPLSALDRNLARPVAAVFGGPPGLIFTGTIGALLLAYVVRFLTVAHNAVTGGYAQISPALDHAAGTLGAGPLRTTARVHAPLLAPSLLAALTLVFVDVMRELPATLMLRPFNFETLATRVYRLAADERLAEASTAALIILAIGVIPLAGFARLASQRDT